MKTHRGESNEQARGMGMNCLSMEDRQWRMVLSVHNHHLDGVTLSRLGRDMASQSTTNTISSSRPPHHVPLVAPQLCGKGRQVKAFSKARSISGMKPTWTAQEASRRSRNHCNSRPPSRITIQHTLESSRASTAPSMARP
jgi:hypothetical protein